MNNMGFTRLSAVLNNLIDLSGKNYWIENYGERYKLKKGKDCSITESLTPRELTLFICGMINVYESELV